MKSKRLKVFLCVTAFVWSLCPIVIWADEAESRRLLTELVLADRTEQEAVLEKLQDQGEPIISEMYVAWRGGQIFVEAGEENESRGVYMKGSDAGVTNLLTGEAASLPEGATVSRASRTLRKKMKLIVDVLDLSAPDLKKRVRAAEKLGLSQKSEYLPVLKERLGKQSGERVKRAFQEAVYISELKNGSAEEKEKAVRELGEMSSLPARDYIQSLLKEAGGENQELKASCATALRQIDQHQSMVEKVGAGLRGLSTGSVLLLVSYGLAITFGLMGVINMAHGEFIAIGGYTVYVLQGLFAQLYGEGSAAYGWYFAASLPCAFLVAALGGVILERGLIRFLYKRPLESLLATWGVSMVLQQLFRVTFGAANVSVSSPAWLSGSYELAGFAMSYNRLLVIGFALLVIAVTWLLLNKTNWGLHVRATMQNRQMASSLGVPSARINMLTFAFGSGLAGLAGAFISQIGNVGPEMGQTYIVDSFMVVVVGGVGNLLGAALSSFGIGLTDQALQPLLGPVMGKISVLLGIILFLQFRPGGLFPARTRSLDD